MEINNDISYMIGIFQTDGSMSLYERNRGKFQLELSLKDEDIIYKLKNIIPYKSLIKKRKRLTSIKEHKYNNETISLCVYDLNFRNELLNWGIPYGKKSKIIKPPLYIKNLSIKDYIRGLYDGDGSLGMTSKNIPYVSFTTDSDDIVNFLKEYISKITNKPLKNIKRNIRDNIYNISITKEDAVKFCNEIYYDGCLSLDRKYQKSIDVKKWVRPVDMVISNKLSWDDYQDNFILNNNLEKSIEYLNRNENSIRMRLWRLKKMKAKR